VNSLIQVHEVTRRFGSFVAADRVSFDVPKGQIFGFLGPNGSGKSTTIRVLAGLLAPTSGRVTGFDGLDVSTDTERWKQQTGYMSQKFSLYLDLTIEENLRFFGMVYGLPSRKALRQGLAGASAEAGLAPKVLRERIRELAARLEFESLLRSLTKTLSTGQRQRVALAASLLHEPKLLFLDEPTGGVDPRGRRMFWDLIYELAAARGLTVLVTTHYMDEAEQCDRLAFILNGRIIAEGRPGDLKHGLLGRILEVDPRQDPFAVLPEAKSHPAIEDVYLFGTKLRLVAHPSQVDEAARFATPLGPFVSAKPSLEDVFVSLARQYAANTEKVAS
jgi:ABC-2 type transport system ATP-binding protein